MKNKFLQYTFLSCALMVLFSACRKDPFNGEATGEKGKTFVYVEQATSANHVSSQFFDVFTNVRPVNMFTVRRDAASKADLQKAVTVTLKADGTLIDAYNTKNGTDYALMPAELYTLGTSTDNPSAAGVTKSADGLSLAFAAGDFAKTVIFKVDGAKVDLSKQYAVAFVITNFGGFSKRHTAAGVSQDTIITTVAIKNRWDGVYTAVGTLNDITSGKPNPTAVSVFSDFQDYIDGQGVADGFVEPGKPMQYEFRTTSATTVELYDNYFYGLYDFMMTSNGGYSYYGNFSPVFVFDPATNKVVDVGNHYGVNAGTQHRSGRLDPTGTVNAYDPATKTVTIRFNMTQPFDAGICPVCAATAPYVRTTYDYVFTYIGSR